MGTPPDPSPGFARACDAAFEAVLAAALLPRGGWTRTPLALREARRVARAIARAQHPDHPPLIFRHESKPWRPDAFARTYDWQAEVFDHFPHDARVTTAATVALLAERQASLTACLPGAPMRDLLARTDDPALHASHLRAAGAWTAAFHGAGRPAVEPFSAEAALAPWRRVRAEVVAGTRLVPEPALFLRGVAWFEARAVDLDGAPMPHAVRHGDLNLRNFLVDGARVGGIDFDPPRRGPVALDLTALLVNHAKEFDWARAASPPGGVWPRAMAEALLDGYGSVPPDDPALPVLAADEVLDLFLRVPGRPEARGPSKRRTLRQVLPLARGLFGTE